MLTALRKHCLTVSGFMVLMGLLCLPSCTRYGFENHVDNPCEGVVCSDAGRCVIVDGQPRCLCNPGYTDDGLECIGISHPCDGVTCSGQGICGVTAAGQVICSCYKGFHPEGDTVCVADNAECSVDRDCDDADPCTDDSCDESLLCRHDFNSAPCDDGLFCTATDACSAGACVGSGEACPGQFCDEPNDACLECQADADCDDGNPCTDDGCQNGSCQHSDNSLACDDGLFCTTTDACAGGSCQGSGDACPGLMCDEAGDACVECLADGDCDDGDVCTDDLCSQGACASVDNTAPCDDGLFCTLVDACSSGACLGSGDSCPGLTCDEAADACVECQVDGDCDDGNICTDDACNSGTCANVNNTAPCDDSLFCTLTDACSGGACQGSGDPCPGQQCDETGGACVDCLVDGDCPADGNECTDDVCSSGVCVYQNNSDPCDDSLFCTLTDVCSGGACVGSGDACPGQGCDEDLDMCTSCVTDGDCADGDVCNGDEVCDTGSCLPGTPLSCDNGMYCDGVETCDPVLGCQSAGSGPCAAVMCNSCDEVDDNCYLELGAPCAPDTPQDQRGANPMYCQDGFCTHWCNNSFEVPGDSDHECPTDYVCWMHMDSDGAGFCLLNSGGTLVTGEPCNDHLDCRSENCLDNRCSDTCSSSLDCTDTGPNTSDYTCLVWEYFLKSQAKVWFDHGACEPAPSTAVVGEACVDSLDCSEGCFTNPDNSRECRNLCCTEDDCSADRVCWPYLYGFTISTVRTCEAKDPRGPAGFGTPCTATEFYDPNCASGLCLDLGQGEQCNRFCCRDLDCPVGFRCEFAFLLPRGGNKYNSMRACIPE